MAKFHVRVSGGKGKPSRSERFFFGVFWPAMFMLGGGIFFAIGLSAILTASASKGWPSVDGVIVSSEVQSDWSSAPAGTPQHRSGTQRVYRADVRYAYTVDGQEYEGDRVEFGGFSSSNAKRAYRIVGTYRKGQTVAVYYDPNDPSRAVLEPGKTTWFSKGAVCAGSGFVLVGLLVGLVVRADFRQRVERAARSAESSTQPG